MVNAAKSPFCMRPIFVKLEFLLGEALYYNLVLFEDMMQVVFIIQGSLARDVLYMMRRLPIFQRSTSKIATIMSVRRYIASNR